MNLSKQAQEVLSILEEVRTSPLTAKYICETDDDGSWLEMTNICNGHVENVPQDYVDLMCKLSMTLNGVLIDNRGQHSAIFYELRKAGYSLRTGESDSFGPLSSVVTIPGTNWKVCYG